MSVAKIRVRDVVVGDQIETVSGVKMSVTETSDKDGKIRVVFVNLQTENIGWWDFEPEAMVILHERRAR